MTGVYLILAQLNNGTEIRVRSGRRFVLGPGFYVYVGSALNNLEARVARHLRRRKKLFWHIDYLLNMARVRTVILAETDQREECFIAVALAKRLSQVPFFGCSDCRCPSHLFFSWDPEVIEKHILEILKERNLIPMVLSDGGAPHRKDWKIERFLAGILQFYYDKINQWKD